MNQAFRSILLVGFACLINGTASGQEGRDGDPDGLAFFESRIRPVLSRHCYKCHSAKAQELQSGLYLDSRAGLARGGDSGPLIDLSRPSESLLIRALRYEELEMPPTGKLPDSVIRDFEHWIEIGLPDSRTAAIPSKRKAIDWDQARRFWSYRPARRYAPPRVKNQRQAKGAIDAFVLQKLEENGLTLNPQADRRTLIRRAYFDLIGLPPSPEEVQFFVDDESPAAYERLIDRLLQSPHYGERWGRHWLDVAGYAESNGIIGDRMIPHAWHYRDYVVAALNKDKSYDRFLTEQFAGDELVDWRSSDELTAQMQEALTATGFLRCTPDGTDNQDIYQLPKRWDHIHATVEVAMKASMGLIINCCRCHDHKFDPVPQQDYYKIVGLFLPAYDPANWLPCTDFQKLQWPLRYVFRAGRSEREHTQSRLASLGRQIKSLQNRQLNTTTRFHDQWLIDQSESAALALTGGQLAALRSSAAQRSVEEARVAANVRSEYPVSDATLREGFPDYRRQFEQISRQISDAQQVLDAIELDKIWALWDVSPSPPESRILIRGDFASPGPVVPAGVPAVLDDPNQPFVLPQPGLHSTGYRLAFARWLVRGDHPLTARVMVNRIWQHHFGRGIVATPDDFGSQGARPTHPELLDWLATTFVDQGWSIKAMHRLIMNSAVYRQSCEVSREKRQLDPDNKWFSRRTPRRIEAELVRDAMLATAGQLDHRIFGEPATVSQLEDGQFVVDPNDPGCQRRGIYIQVRRTTPVSLIQTFDGPQMDTNVPQRSRSNVPSQALALMNNPFVIRSARGFAERLWNEESRDLTQRIERAFEIAFGRLPNDRESKISRDFFRENASEDSWQLFCQGLFASNEFLFVN